MQLRLSGFVFRGFRGIGCDDDASSGSGSGFLVGLVLGSGSGTANNCSGRVRPIKRPKPG